LVTGLFAGLAAWRLTGTRVPVFADGLTSFGVPLWPSWTGVAWPVGAMAVVLLAVAYAAAWDLRRVVRRGSQAPDVSASNHRDNVKQLESVGSPQ
jgi:hypothetical protein